MDRYCIKTSSPNVPRYVATHGHGFASSKLEEITTLLDSAEFSVLSPRKLLPKQHFLTSEASTSSSSPNKYTGTIPKVPIEPVKKSKEEELLARLEVVSKLEQKAANIKYFKDFGVCNCKICILSRHGRAGLEQYCANLQDNCSDANCQNAGQNSKGQMVYVNENNNVVKPFQNSENKFYSGDSAQFGSSSTEQLFWCQKPSERFEAATESDDDSQFQSFYDYEEESFSQMVDEKDLTFICDSLGEAGNSEDLSSVMNNQVDHYLCLGQQDEYPYSSYSNFDSNALDKENMYKAQSQHQIFFPMNFPDDLYTREKAPDFFSNLNKTDFYQTGNDIVDVYNSEEEYNYMEKTLLYDYSKKLESADSNMGRNDTICENSNVFENSGTKRNIHFDVNELKARIEDVKEQSIEEKLDEEHIDQYETVEEEIKEKLVEKCHLKEKPTKVEKSEEDELNMKKKLVKSFRNEMRDLKRNLSTYMQGTDESGDESESSNDSENGSCCSVDTASTLLTENECLSDLDADNELDGLESPLADYF